MNGQHLFPARGPRESGIGHFSSDLEVRLDIILPGLPLLDALFGDLQRRIHVHGLITVKNPPAITDNGRWRAEARKRGKEHLQVIPLILRRTDFAC